MSAFRSFCAAAAAALATISALDVTGFAAVLPYDWAKWLVIALSACATLAHLFTALAKTGTPSPDAAKTASQRILPLLLIVAVTAISLGMTSCAGWSLRLTSPYGSATSDDSGTVYTPPTEPIVISPSK